MFISSSLSQNTLKYIKNRTRNSRGVHSSFVEYVFDLRAKRVQSISDPGVSSKMSPDP